jgi:hypothetical protein
MTKTPESSAQPSTRKDRPDRRTTSANGNGDTTGTSFSGQLDDLARAQQELQQEARQLVVRELMDREPNGDEEARGGRVLTAARAELLQQLIAEQQEQARRQLIDAARSSEDAVDGVVRSINSIVRTVVPAALVRPEGLIEGTFNLADQGLRISRRLALTLSAGVRNLVPLD